MDEIILESIKRESGAIEFAFKTKGAVSEYFSDAPFEIEYPISVERVPESVCAIPFVANVLPIVWLTDSELIVPELDQDFFESIPEFKAGFVDMYPGVAFGGRITVERVVRNDLKGRERYRSACFFSGGVDATTTVLRHFDERPLLVTLWGSDVRCWNEAGWEVLRGTLQEAAERYKLPLTFIKTTFRDFDRENQLDQRFSAALERGYWYGVKHGIGIISHIAPLAWMYGIEKVYMASSNCPEDGTRVKCASDPRIDNRVRFCGARVFHDAFELSRQKKVAYIAKFRRSHPELPIELHVCWESDDGKNCCRCEKCYRTMAELWIEGGDPKDYGFDYPRDVFQRMYKFIALQCDHMAKNTWTFAKNRINENWPALRKDPNVRKLRWIRTFDFQHWDRNIDRRTYRFLRKIKHTVFR